MLLDQVQKYAIKVNGQIQNTYSSMSEAQVQLLNLKSQNPQLIAEVVVVDNQNRQMLLG
jgi:hypothetical protein